MPANENLTYPYVLWTGTDEQYRYRLVVNYEGDLLDVRVIYLEQYDGIDAMKQEKWISIDVIPDILLEEFTTKLEEDIP